MGSGKSSVMDAVSFALFGSFPDLASKRVTLANLIMNRPTNETSAEVSVSFEVEGQNYKVTRGISSGSSSEAKLEKEGKYLQTQPERVTEAIEELLKVNYDTFSRAIYAQQNQLNYFLDLSKGERKRSIDEMLGLNNFSVAEDNATSLVNSTRSLIEGEQQTLSSINVSEFKAQLEALTKERQDLEKVQGDLTLQSKELRTKIDEIAKRLLLAKKENDARKKLGDELRDINSRVSTLNEEVRKIDSLNIDEKRTREDAQQSKEKLAVLDREAESLKLRERNAVRELSEAEAAVKSVQKEIAERDRLLAELKGKELSGMEKRLEEESKTLEALKEANLSRKAVLGEAKRWSEELKQHISKCPICERDLTEEMRKSLLDGKSRQTAQLEREIVDESSKISGKEEMNKKLKGEIEALSKKKEKLGEYSNTDKKYAEAEALLKSRSAVHASSIELSDKKAKEYKELKEKADRLSRDMEGLNRKKVYLEEIGKGNVLINEKKQAYDAIKVDDKLIYSVQDELTDASSKASDINSKVEGNSKYLSSIGSRISDKQKEIESFGKIEERIREKREMLANLNKFKSALVETEAVLRNRLVGSINSIMQSLWPELYPYADYSGLKMEANKEDYLLQTSTLINGAESWVSIESVASGGERSIACLTMRIALAMVIVPNLKWLILDEPTHNIDSTGIEKLINVLGGTLPKVVEQVFIITHDESLKQINEATVFQLDRDKSSNSATTISAL